MVFSPHRLWAEIPIRTTHAYRLVAFQPGMELVLNLLIFQDLPIRRPQQLRRRGRLQDGISPQMGNSMVLFFATAGSHRLTFLAHRSPMPRGSTHPLTSWEAMLTLAAATPTLWAAAAFQQSIFPTPLRRGRPGSAS